LINHIHIINGPNLNLLGRREVDIYGIVSFESYFEELKNQFPEVHLSYFQSNHEGYLIDKLHEVGFETDTGIILNAGGLSHTSISLRDAVGAITTPVVEVHISDIHKREEFRRHSFLTEVCLTHYIGRGLDGYQMAVEYLIGEEVRRLGG
jgi:3-dehydroquinate dehydratase II